MIISLVIITYKEKHTYSFACDERLKKNISIQGSLSPCQEDEG